MKYISSVEEFSELKKVCLEILSQYKQDTLNVFVIDADNPDLENICGQISALPTIDIYISGKRTFHTQGFQKDLLHEKFSELLNNDNDEEEIEEEEK